MITEEKIVFFAKYMDLLSVTLTSNIGPWSFYEFYLSKNENNKYEPFLNNVFEFEQYP